MPKLIIRAGPLSGAELSFAGDAIVGRGTAADLGISDPSVSRRHARLTLRDGRCFIEDLGSANGTRVNGTRVSQAVALGDGDRVDVGFVRTMYSAQEPVPEPSALGYRDDESRPGIVYSIPADERPAADAVASQPATALATRLRFLEDFGKIAGMVFDPEALFAFVVAELLELMPQADRAFVMAWASGEQRLRPAAIRTRSGTHTEIVASQTLLHDVIDTKAAVLVVDTFGDRRYADAESIHALGIRAAICAPIMFQKQLYGVLQVDSAAGVPFGQPDVALVLSLASQVGMALATARLHAELVERELVEHDLQLATRLQHHFLPREAPDLPGYAFAFEYRPALAVGGDFYDFLDLDGRHVGIVTGDVSGKGVSAALYAAKLTSDLRYQAASQTSPAAILERTNRALAGRDNERMFATAVVAVLDAETGGLDVAGAGHPQALLRRADGRVEKLGKLGSLPLGLEREAPFEACHHTLGPGEVAVFYTDGVTEALDEREAVFGDDRLIEAVTTSDGTAAGTRDRMRSAVAAFAAPGAASDDLTIVCVERVP